MNIRHILGRSRAVVGLAQDIRRVSTWLSRVTKLGRDIGRMRRYCASQTTRKLQLGAGPTILEGWLCTDILPESDQVLYLDVTEPFPFDDNVFDYIYCEHMIEHLSWHEGLSMLKECRRILKPGGAIRIATPDLTVLLGLYAGEHDPASARYIDWIMDKFLADMPAHRAAFVINNAFRNWGHHFLYNYDLLQMAMREAGFRDVRRYATGESDDDHLRGLEFHGKNVDAFEMANFETMAVEGR
jgi:predicted SAM-dependent methyltransferase